MEFVKFPKIPRYSRECSIQEKIDGTLGQILIAPVVDGVVDPIAVSTVFKENVGYSIYAGSKKAWLSEINDNYGFARWVRENSLELLKLGEGRHFGEFWGYKIQRGYGLKERRFSLFNVKKWSDPLVRPACCYVVPVVLREDFTTHNVMLAMDMLQKGGSLAAPGFLRPEGIIIYHRAGNLLFKKTFLNDEKGKGEE